MQSESHIADGECSTSTGQTVHRLITIRQELTYLNTIGKRFVAAFDRFHVHRALLATLQELYQLSACCILLKADPYELFIIPCYPLDASFLEAMVQRIASAANVIDFPYVDADHLAQTAYLDAPDELAQGRRPEQETGNEIGSCLNIPLTVENRIIGLLSLFDERRGSFDTDLLQLTTMIADYAAVALENVRLRERENALWRQAELERQRLELIIRSMAEGLLITDARGTITALNQSAQYLLAQVKVELQPKMSLRIQAAESDIPWVQRLAEIVGQAQKGIIVTNQELVASTENDLVPLTLNVSAAPLHDATSSTTKPIGVVTVLNDVTSTKQVERLKDEFVSVVSHELRTPLTAIKGYTQHLARRIERRIRKMHTTIPEPLAVGSEPAESYDLRSLNIIQSQTEHLERLVNDLLDLSQVQWGQLNLSYESFYLADVLSECVHSVQASAEQHTITMDIQVEETLVTADRVRICQVIGNILDNAVKYSPNGGQVNVRLNEEKNGDFQISIIDQGIGVSPQQFDHIFERFYRVHNMASQQYSGIGLGLYVAKAIIDRHGGHIWLTNNAGLGTTFHFTVPVRPRTRILADSGIS
ncbi:MAG TPA: ATP-binding protein [Ktedonobacteraceae bacterium]|nr:ATP-binding protein [Ktedonobacteraceae bacterium]